MGIIPETQMTSITTGIDRDDRKRFMIMINNKYYDSHYGPLYLTPTGFVSVHTDDKLQPKHLIIH